MKIFVGWSGEASKAAAAALSDAVRDVFEGVEPWMSAADIQPGQQWFPELMAALEGTRFAVVCLTARTLHAPWLLFEAGAVAAKFGASKVVPLLLDCQPKDLGDPLARFQTVGFDRASIRRLFDSINETLEVRLKPKTLSAAFDGVWIPLEVAVRAALDSERAAGKAKFDVFLSAPMASFSTDAAYQAFRAETMKVVTALRGRCKLVVFCALEGIDSLSRFETHGTSTHEDMAILRQSACFVLLYPSKLPTSSLFEAGYALALGLPSRYFVRAEEDLPYLMQRLPEAFTNVSILDAREWKSYDDIAARMEQNSAAWFSNAARAELK